MNGPNDDSAGTVSPIASVVVTYQPDEAVVENIRRLTVQCDRVILVDNASSGTSVQWISAAAKLPGVLVIRNEANLGIASAMNIGIRKALEEGFSWVATFDQDTGVPPDFFRKLLQTYRQCPESEKVGMIVSGGWAETGTVAVGGGETELKWSFVIGAVNSGSLLKAETARKIGLYDDALFIDYVDTDFCLRLLKHGLKILSADSVVLEHELGHKQTRNILGCRISFRIHAAWRYYYNFRNRIVLFRRFVGTFPKWVLWDGSRMFLELGRIVFLESGRWPKVRAALCGMKDGVFGRVGRHPLHPPK